MSQTQRKPLIVYYSHEHSQIGEIAHKIALDVQGDIYEIKTPKKLTEKELKKDGRKLFSKICIVYDSIDFSQYNEIFIGGEWMKKHVIGPIRQWIEQNKSDILKDDVKLFFFGFDTHGKNINKTINEMVEMIGEPYRRLIVSPSDYPYHHLARKIGYHQTLSKSTNEESQENEEEFEGNEIMINTNNKTHLIHSKQQETSSHQPCCCDSTMRTV